MKLIPPTHGLAVVRRTVPHEGITPALEETARRVMLESMNRLFQKKFGTNAPEAWLSWDVVGGGEIRLSAEAPSTARRYFDALRNSVRRVPVPVSLESRIPIVASSYRYDDANPFRRDDHVLTFQGWDGETGLMVFDR